MKFACPHCGNHIEAEAGWVGDTIACPHVGCGKAMQIPVSPIQTQPRVESPPHRVAATPPVFGPQYQGVGGWLLFFCVILTVISPLRTLFNLGESWNIVTTLQSKVPRFAVITATDTILSLAVMTFSIYAGIKLWRVRPAAVQTAKTCLWCYLGYTVMGMVLPFMSGFSSEVNQAMIEPVAKSALQGVFFFAIWYSYLKKSVRVRLTYESGTSVFKTSEDAAYVLLEEAIHLEAKYRFQEALLKYQQVVTNCPQTAAAADAQKSIESLQRKMS